MPRFIGRLLITCLLAIGSAHAASAQQVATPEQCTKVFYEWYLAQLAADKDPVSDDSPALKDRVATPLLRLIERKRRSPDGMDADYFIQAQDYLDDWLVQVSVKPRTISKTTAKVDATLGEKPDTSRKLRVTLIRESGTWKISRVQAATP